MIWYHDGRPVKESKDIQLLFRGDQCSLVIKETFAEDAGEYRVVAINSAGETDSRCVLHVDVKPGAIIWFYSIVFARHATTSSERRFVCIQCLTLTNHWCRQSSPSCYRTSWSERAIPLRWSVTPTVVRNRNSNGSETPWKSSPANE